MNTDLRKLLPLVAALTACGAPEPVRKVLLIGVDGVRVDVLASAATPNIDALIATGKFSDRARTGSPTVSGPSWSSMLIGVWPEKHGVHGNDFSDNEYDDFPDFLTRLEQVDPEFRTYAIVDWPPLGSTAAGGPLIGDLVDVRRMIDGDSLGYATADSISVAVAVRYLESEDPDAMFVYLGNVDVVGHDRGSLAPEYRRAIEVADGQVGELVAAMKRRSTYEREDWLVLVSTDHGRRDDGGHGGESDLEHTIFYLAAGPGAARGQADFPEIVDVAVTALTHLGITIDTAWQLDGRSVGLRNRN